MSRNWRLLLDDILACCDRILEYTAGMNEAALRTDCKTFDAVVRNIEVLGEAVTRMPAVIRSQLQDIEWQDIIGMRNRLIHAYFAVDPGIVSNVAFHDVPALREALGSFLESPSTSTVLLNVDGAVLHPLSFALIDFQAIDSSHQIVDVSALDPKRSGTAVRFSGILSVCGARESAKYVTLHSSKDDFHASIPLVAVRDRAIIIYSLDGQPLPEKAGGPVRFFIPNFAACNTHEIDECANVKFVDRIELTAERGFDNRPHDEKEHAELHEKEQK